MLENEISIDLSVAKIHLHNGYNSVFKTRGIMDDSELRCFRIETAYLSDCLLNRLCCERVKLVHMLDS